MRAAAWKGSLHLDSREAESPGHGNWISLESLTERRGVAGSRPEVNAGSPGGQCALVADNYGRYRKRDLRL